MHAGGVGDKFEISLRHGNGVYFLAADALGLLANCRCHGFAFRIIPNAAGIASRHPIILFMNVLKRWHIIPAPRFGANLPFRPGLRHMSTAGPSIELEEMCRAARK